MSDNKMAFVYFVVEGNEKFGGYVSVNGGDYMRAYNGFSVAVPVGPCALDLTDEDPFTRGYNKFASSLNSFNKAVGQMTSPSLLTTVIDAAGDREVEKNSQRTSEHTWHLEAELGDGEVLIAAVMSSGSNIAECPKYDVMEMNDALAAAIEEDIGQRDVDEGRRYAVAFWLCLFLGSFSVHRFYLKWPYPWIYLFTGQLFGIGWLIDFIRLLVKYIEYIKMKKAA